MRRRVVCPRSHPASPYLRRPSGAFASARSFPRGGRPPGTPGWDAYPVGRQLRPWCVGPLAAPWSLGLMVCPDTSVGAAVCTFKQRCARLEGTHSPPEILTRAPTSGPETRPPRCRRVHRQPSRELPAAVRPAGHWPRTGPSPRAGGIPALGGRWVTWPRSSVRGQVTLRTTSSPTTDGPYAFAKPDSQRRRGHC